MDTPNNQKKFLFVSRDGLIHDLAFAVQKEGSIAKYAIMAKSEQDVADGFIEKHRSLKPTEIY